MEKLHVRNILLKCAMWLVPTLSVALILGFAAKSQNISADKLKIEFERQNFIEIYRGDALALTRRLNALFKTNQIRCIKATKAGEIFFEESKGECKNWFSQSRKVTSSDQSVEILFSYQISNRELSVIAIFVLLQSLVLVSLLFLQRQITISAFEGQIQLGQLAKQVAHDIQSPLAVIASSENVGENVRKAAMIRLKELCDHLLGKRGFPFLFLPTKILRDICFEKEAELGSKIRIECDFDDATKRLVLSGDQFIFRRAFSNLLNNAHEAKNSENANVKIRSFIIEENFLTIELSDYGKGISPEKIEKIRHGGLSHGKRYGSGIGISSAISLAESFNGTFDIRSEIGKVTSIILKLRISELDPVVLIDDDSSLGHLWALSAQRHKISYFYFATVEDFLSKCADITKSAMVFVDTEFKGNKLDLRRFSAELTKLGFYNTHLATGHIDPSLLDGTHFNSILGKEPPWLADL